MTVAMGLRLRHDQHELVDHQRHQSQQVHPEHQQRETDRSGHLDARLPIAGIDRAEFGEQIAQFAHAGILAYWNKLGNSTEMPYRVDRTMIDTTMTPPIRFWPRVLRRSPIVARSFNSRIKNTSAAGSSVTAITCTNKVINTSGACGIRTTKPEVTSMRK